MKVSPKSTSVVLIIALSCLLLVDCKAGKDKAPGSGGKKGIGKAVKTAAVVAGTGAAGYIAYKGIKKATKHNRSDGIRMSASNHYFLILTAIALGTIRWY